MEAYFPAQMPPAGRDMDLPRIRRFLSSLSFLPAELRGKLPVLTDIAALCAGTPPYGPAGRGLDRRYLRICFVQSELERLDFRKAGPGVIFNDFVFDQIDFSTYKKISEKDFALYSREGLEDFDASFFTRNFRLSRESALALIKGAYTRADGFYRIKQEKMLSNCLLMPVLRTLQTSLEFAPLFTKETVLDEYRALLCFLGRPGKAEGAETGELWTDRLFTFLLKALHNVFMIHPDGMKTDLSVLEEKKTLALRGTFHPLGKAYTVRLMEAQDS
ncbi:MAG: hypothetical protein LBU18_04750 [Treponema sp.]|jgi:hypothetical protein|nr:hypothetical protein [Treponema sp.]